MVLDLDVLVAHKCYFQAPLASCSVTECSRFVKASPQFLVVQLFEVVAVLPFQTEVPTVQQESQNLGVQTESLQAQVSPA